MVVSSMLEFGGLEEFMKNLAVGVQQTGQEVSVFSTTWVSPDNQYMRGLRENHIRVFQLPRWLSMLTTDWATKEKVLALILKLSIPIIFLLAIYVMLARKKNWQQSCQSAGLGLQGFLQRRVIGPDQRRPFARLYLDWWRLFWRPDVIHIHGYTSTLLFVIDWAYRRKVPVVYEEHQTPDPQFDWWKDFKTSINKASMVVAVSEISAKALREVCGVTGPMTVAYYMVPDPYETGWSAGPERDAGDGLVRITTPARLYVTKGLTYLLEAIVKVRKVHPNVQFKVYGDGPLRQELLDYAAKLGLDGSQIFAGAYTSREQLSQIMAQTDLFVMSSILEGLPIALLEAISYGLPVVVTPAGGIPEAIQDEVNGLMCQPRDPDCLAEKINCLIEDPVLRQRLARAARKTYEQGPFHPKAVSRHFVEIYQQVLAAKEN
jgi:glycosyltransferase involved in cell wall biosynthesis